MGFPAAPACGILHGVKRVATCCLCALLCLGQPAHAYSSYGDDNPFVEAMLRMMELFGLINRARLPLGVPYAPGYGTSTIPGLGGLSGIGAYSALGGLPGVLEQRSLSRYGLSSVTAVFDDDVDPWLARQQVAERLATLGELPAGVESPICPKRKLDVSTSCGRTRRPSIARAKRNSPAMPEV